MPSRILVVYYSRSGHTKRIADRIVDALGADVEAIADRANRAGPLGYLRSLYEAVRERPTDIAAPTHDPDSYPMIIIGTPIWAMRPSSPVRTYLRRHRDALRSVAFFATCGGSGAERAFAEMSRDCGKQPTTTLIVRAADLERPAGIDRFIADLRAGEVDRDAAAKPPSITPLPPG